MHVSEQRRRRTHCPRGHPFDEANTYRWKTARVCRTCRKANNKAWEQAHPKKKRDSWRKWYAKNYDPAQRRIKGREQLYGLSHKEQQELFEASDGLRAVCYEVPAVAIDHHHVTGEVRGAVCHKCNQGLHYLDKEGWMENAHIYLETVVMSP